MEQKDVKFEITMDQIQKMVNYLSEKPLKESYDLVQLLLSLKPAKDSLALVEPTLVVAEAPASETTTSGA